MLNRDELHQMYVVEQMSANKIGKLAGVHHSKIDRLIEEFKISKRSRRDGQLLAVKGRRKPASHRAKISEALKDRYKLARHHAWKTGRTKTSEGYVYVKCPGHQFANANNSVLEHRLVMETSIGRYLTVGEVVHHINEIKDDNRIENLHLFASGNDHTYFHSLSRWGRTVELKYEYEQIHRDRKMG